jgi:hypothetical protein
MDTKDTQIVSFRVTAEELQQLDKQAAEMGLGRTEYLRSRIFAPDPGPKIAALEKQLHELTDRLGREADRQEARKCNNPEHKKIFGVGHCFTCDLPIESRF